MILLAFSLGPLFISNLLGYLGARRYLIEAAHRDIQNVAALEAARTQILVRARVDAVARRARSDRALASALARDAEGAVRVALGSGLDAVADHDERALEYVALTAAGSAVVVGDSVSGGKLALAVGICRAWRPGAPGVAGFTYESVEPTIWLASSVKDQAGRVVGRLCGGYYFHIHTELVHAKQTRDASATLFVVDASGDVLCGSEEVRGRPEHGHAAVPAIDDLRPFWSDAAWSRSVELRGGELLLAAFAPLPEQGWGILVAIPMKVALRGLDRMKWQAVALGTALALLLMATILATARAFSRRLANLARAATRISGGAFGEQVAADGPKEVADLAGAFNQMSAALHEAHEHLEQRIVERTEALRANQEFSELLLDSVDRWVVVVDREHRIVKANAVARARFGEHLVGAHYHRAVEDRDAPREGCPVVAASERGEPQRREQPQRLDGAQEIVDIEAWPMLNRDGDAETVVVLGRVVTEQLRQQAQMIHNERMAAFGLLAAGIAHDIGNPLASIKSQLVVTRRRGGPERTEETLEVVEREVDRIARMLRRLTDFARRRRDGVMLVSINRIIEDVVGLLTHDPRARNVAIETALGGGIPGLRAREDDLVQVLLNLGINALDAMPSGGRLSYHTRATEDGVEIRVSDTGTGVPNEAAERLFDPFFTTKATGKGTGLGLFVSRRIVSGMGGRLLLAETSAAGTTFAVHLPVSSSLPTNP